MIDGSSFFFFQAEDGIRDLVRSRGLGDVYKRQVVINKVDRQDARIKEVIDETYALFMDLVEDDQAHLLDFPIVYCAAKAGRASLNKPEDGGFPDSENLQPLFETIFNTC